MTRKRGRPPAVRPKKKKISRPYATFGSALILLRLRTGKKQMDIAEEAGVTKGMLSSWETGRQRPTMESLTKLLEVLGADFGDLQGALDASANRPMRATASNLRQWELAEEEMDRERRIGRAVLDVAVTFAEGLRGRSAPELRIVGSIGGSRRAGKR